MNEFKKRLNYINDYIGFFGRGAVILFIIITGMGLLFWLMETFKIISIIIGALLVIWAIIVMTYVLWKFIKFIYWLFIEPFIKK